MEIAKIPREEGWEGGGDGGGGRERRKGIW